MKALITTDGSSLSLAIAGVARQLAELAPDVELHVLKVLNPREVRESVNRRWGHSAFALGPITVRSPLPELVESHGEALERRHHEEVEKMREAFGRELGEDRPITYHIRWGESPADEITDAAQGLEVDLIMMATHGRSGMSHLVAGSVAEEVIRTSGLPVLVQCPHEGGKPGTVAQT